MKLNINTNTNWSVITGAPCSGKTSVIGELARRGYPVRVEVAREVIAQKLRAGETLEDVRRDNKLLQREILARKCALERELDPEEAVFLDRGVPDSITYFRLAGLDPEEAVRASRVFRYRHVFIFDRLPLVRGGVRSEDEAEAGKIDEMIEADHRALGYAPVRVPVMSIADRADYVLAALAH